jgi:hypothetical protein
MRRGEEQERTFCIDGVSLKAKSANGTRHTRVRRLLVGSRPTRCIASRHCETAGGRNVMVESGLLPRRMLFTAAQQPEKHGVTPEQT